MVSKVVEGTGRGFRIVSCMSSQQAADVRRDTWDFTFASIIPLLLQASSNLVPFLFQDSSLHYSVFY